MGGHSSSNSGGEGAGGHSVSPGALVLGVGEGDNDGELPTAATASAAAETIDGAQLSSLSASRRGDREEEAGVWFYVGESDAIRERLKRHANRWGGGGGSGSGSGISSGSKASELDAVVVPVENRSEARRLETAVIRAMKQEGFHLVSDKDGSRNHFSSSV